MLLESCLGRMCKSSTSCTSLVRRCFLRWLTFGRKWFLKALGVEQFHKLLAGFEDKNAQAVCTFAYCEGPGKEVLIFQGRTKVCCAAGPIAFFGAHTLSFVGKDRRCKRSNDFRWVFAPSALSREVLQLTCPAGWDACFEYGGQTYAEMPATEKNKISHRGKALDKLKEWLEAETS